VKVYTISIANAKRLEIIKNKNYVDVTLSTGEKLVAPTWNMIRGVKSGKITESEYTVMYNVILTCAAREHKEEFVSLFKKVDYVILGCYCPPGAFCHRTLLSQFLVEYFKAEFGGEITSKGQML
jgi:hypothetical protein